MVTGIIDSGIGGLTTAAEIIRVCGGGRYIYLLDNAGHPYGTKERGELTDIMRRNCDTLLGMGAQAIVIACNTATAACIDVLRREYPGVPFIGTEPSVRTAAAYGRSVMVLATPLTVRQERFARLLTDGDYMLPDCSRLADAVEKGYPCLLQAKKILYKAVAPYRGRNVDCVVLGCTHYCLLREYVTSLMHAPCVDGNGGVARQVRRICGADGREAEVSLTLTDMSAAERYYSVAGKILKGVKIRLVTD